MFENTTAIVAAAGAGKRLNCGENKVFYELEFGPILNYSLRLFDRAAAVTEIIVTAAPGEEDRCGDVCRHTIERTPFRVVTGGADRDDSVWAALESLDEGIPLVFVHDGARPFCSPILLEDLWRAMGPGIDGVIPALPVKETVKLVQDHRIVETVPRQALYLAQTPQLFIRTTLRNAYVAGREVGFNATDDASMVERYGGVVRVIEGEANNIKITTAADLSYAAWLEAR